MIDWMVDIIFIIDIIINFRTIIMKQGIEIFDPWLIAKEYMKFSLWIDLLTVFPIDKIVGHGHPKPNQGSKPGQN